MTLGYLDNSAALGGFVTIEQWAKKHHYTVQAVRRWCVNDLLPAQQVSMQTRVGDHYQSRLRWVVRENQPPPVRQRQGAGQRLNPKPRKDSRHPLGLSVFEAKLLHKAAENQLHHAVKTVIRMADLGLLKYTVRGNTAHATLTQPGWKALREAQELGMLSSNAAQ